MTEAYRTKLAHWAFSMLSLHLLLLVGISYDAFWAYLWEFLPAPFGWTNSEDIVLLRIMAQFDVYMILGILLFIWHFADFLQNDGHAFRLPWRIDGYLWLGATFWAFGVSYLLAMSTFLNDLGCPEFASSSSMLAFSAAAASAPNNQFVFLDGCGMFVPLWKQVPLWTTLLAIPVLTAVKVASSIASQIRCALSARKAVA